MSEYNQKQLAQINARSTKSWRFTLAFHVEAMLRHSMTFTRPVEFFIKNHHTLALTAGIEGYFTSNPNKYLKFLDEDEVVVYAKDQIAYPGIHDDINLNGLSEEEKQKEQDALMGKLIFNFDAVLVVRDKNGKGNVTRVIFVEFKSTRDKIVYNSINHSILRLAALKKGIEENAGVFPAANSVSIEFLLITKPLNDAVKTAIKAAGAFFGIKTHILENYTQIEKDFIKTALV